MITSYKDWYPTCVECKGKLDNEKWFDAQPSLPNGPYSNYSMSMGSIETHPKIMGYTYLMNKHTKKAL